MENEEQVKSPRSKVKSQNRLLTAPEIASCSSVASWVLRFCVWSFALGALISLLALLPADRLPRASAQNVSSPLPVLNSPSTSTLSTLSQTTLSANTAQLIKSSAGNVYGWSLYNGNSSVCYLQFYNSSSAPTCGTSVTWSFPLPASSTSTVVPPYALYNHTTGIGFCAGTTASGSTACSTALSGTLLWK